MQFTTTTPSTISDRKPLPGSNEPYFQVVSVTPELAAEWLGHNGANRNIRDSNVARFARDMQGGRWNFIGDPIRLGVPGADGYPRLLDGQNRLTAIVQSGSTQPFMVFFNVSDEAQAVMDSGASRTVGDTLTMQGHGKGAQLAATIRIIWQIGLGPARFGNVRDAATNSEIMAMQSANPLIEASLLAVEGVRKGGLRYPPAAVSHYFGMIQEPEMTTDFFEKMRTGVGMRDGEPVLVLRNRLNDDKKYTTPQQLYLTLRALNLTRLSKDIDRLILPRSATGVAGYGPKIVGEVRKLTSKMIIDDDMGEELV